MFHICVKIFLSCIFILTFILQRNLQECQTQTPEDLLTAFQKIHTDSVWPTPCSNRSMVSSTFGPRIKRTTGKYDFHRGIDIHGNIGDPVLASYNGLVKKIGTYYDGGKYVILEHTFHTPVRFHDKTITKWYSLYLHLHVQLVTVGDTVTAGEIIGEVGKTGASTVTPHLHHEIRIGARCSIEYQVTNPSSTCNRLGFDPHVHALLAYPPHVNSTTSGTAVVPTVTVTQEMDSTHDGIITLETPDTDPNVNRYNVQVIDNITGTVMKEHTLDLNMRIGFIVTSTTALDTPNTNFPYLDPISFRHIMSTWNGNLVVPLVWLPTKSANQKIVITITTIWEDTVSTEFGLNVSW